jgi:hypothetical protein
MISEKAVEALLQGVREVLKGIDQEEAQSADGWWETSDGAAFGAKALANLEKLIRASLN